MCNLVNGSPTITILLSVSGCLFGMKRPWNVHSKQYIGSSKRTIEYYYHATPGEPWVLLGLHGNSTEVYSLYVHSSCLCDEFISLYEIKYKR